MEVRTILTPAEIAGLPARDLGGTVCVVFDVLRATSTIVAALGSGARRVFPALTVDEALELRRDTFPGALLAGERGGQRIDGFDLGNSPREFSPSRVSKRDIITTTTNGTVALRACAQADAVLAAGLINVDATAEWLIAHSNLSTLLLVCAGTGTNFAFEDGLGAGAVLARLSSGLSENLDDASRAMLALYDRSRANLAEALRGSENGRRLAEIGLGEDVGWCARLSVLDEVALLHEGSLQSAWKLLHSPISGANRELPPAPKLE